MKAYTIKKYGSPEAVLEMKDLPKPTLKEGEVLVKVKATTINDYDYAMVSGKPFVYRLLFGLTQPKSKTPGMEVAGILEEVKASTEENADGLKVGDEVYGDISDHGFGTFAEYLAINKKALIKKPTTMSFEEAAASPHAFLLAWQSLKGKLQGKKTLLINGAGGGVGFFALQIAKEHGLQVTGVDSNKKLSQMKKIGFDEVMDYRKENFTKTKKTYDLILDCKSNQSAFAYSRTLENKGEYITVGGKTMSLLGIFFWGKLLSLFTSKKFSITALKANHGIAKLHTLAKEKKINWLIDGPYAFSDIPRLVEYFGKGEHMGKIVVKL